MNEFKRYIFSRGIIEHIPDPDPDPDPPPPVASGIKVGASGVQLDTDANDECTGGYNRLISLSLEQNVRDWILSVTTSHNVAHMGYVMLISPNPFPGDEWYMLETNNPQSPKVRATSSGEITEVRVCP